MKLKKLDFDLRNLCQDALKIIAMVGLSKGIKIYLYIDVKVNTNIRSDPLRLKQILLNFLSYSMKYSPSGIIAVKVNQDKKKKISIQILDTGCKADFCDESQLKNTF